MGEKEKEKKTKELTVKELRKRGVKPREEVVELVKKQREIVKKIKECLKSGPKTIPEIAAETGVPSGVVTWYVMTLYKYGEITPGEEVDGYYKYMLSEEEGGE